MHDESTMPFRRCYACHEEKPLDEFHRSKGHAGGRKYECKECCLARAKRPEDRVRRRTLQSQRYAAIRDTFHALKNRPCMDCGGSFPHYVMEFDHPNRTVKTATISQMAMAGITQRLLDEIAKTDLVCSNCHRIRTRRQFERGEWKTGRPRFDGTHHTDDTRGAAF